MHSIFQRHAVRSMSLGRAHIEHNTEVTGRPKKKTERRTGSGTSAHHSDSDSVKIEHYHIL